MDLPGEPTSAPPAPESAGLSLPALNAESAARPQPVASHAVSWARFLGFAALGLTLDLWSKEWAFHAMRQGDRWELIPRVLEFQTMLNAGALFGIGRGQTELFLAASLLALILVGWMFLQTTRRNWLLQIALGAILAGALGNMHDRVFIRLVEQPIQCRDPVPPRQERIVWLKNTGRDGSGQWVLREFPVDSDGVVKLVREQPVEVGFVRDFIKIPTRWFGKELWPWVFNVADMLLVGGVSILAVFLWRTRRPENAADGAAAVAGDGSQPAA